MVGRSERKEKEGEKKLKLLFARKGRRRRRSKLADNNNVTTISMLSRLCERTGLRARSITFSSPLKKREKDSMK